MIGVALVLLLAIPWLQPFIYGPTPTIVQSLLAWSSSSTWWLLCNAVRDAESDRVHTISYAWMVAALLSAAMGLTQYFGIAGIFGSLVNTADIGQAYANLRQRNQLATLLNMGLAAAFALTFDIKRNVAQWRGVVILFAALLAAANAATGSRTGFFQLWVLIAMGLWWRQEPKLLFLTAIAYSVAAVMLPMLSGTNPFASGILSRVAENNLACTSRLTLWSNVLHLIAQKPWLGWGWGELDYAHFITLYPGERFCDILDNAHNLPLHLAVELGIPVAAAFCGACAWLVWRNKPWSEMDPTRQLAWGVLAVIGLHSMLEYPLWYGPFQLAVVLCTWLLWRSPEADTERAPGPMFTRAATGAAAVTLLAFCAYAAWDYWRISQIYLPPSARNAAYKDDTLAKIQGSWLFRDQVRFAELTTTPLDEDNAAHVHALAKDMLHFSPEPRVVEKVIESAVMLHQDDEAMYYLQRYKAAFPAQHARWSAALKVPQ
ncbi:MAG: O-antigen ligase C-terminal domain-containing protein [Burkholderiales bacterium]|nr:O-antigen ligase C-terminal domain-containing protein [Burkholderiales bacterium]